MSDKDYFKLLTGKKFQEATRIPSLQETVEKQWKTLHSGNQDDLLSLGVSQEVGDIWVTQEERENHFWILGSTGEGKSRFLQYLIRKDIDRLYADRHLPKNKRRSCSLCFIDSTPQGANAHQILNYCAQIGFKKVFLVDPHQIVTKGKVPPINPFNYDKSYITDSVDYLKDAFRVLFDVEDESRTAYITTYLTAVFTLLHHAGLTLKELLYFTLPFDKTIPLAQEYEEQRDKIYDLVTRKMESPDFPETHREIVRKNLAEVDLAFKNIPNFAREFGSTARRINAFINNPNVSLIFGHRKGVNFEKLISDGWILLVNASTGSGVGTLPSRLLATIVINQIISTIERLRKGGAEKGFDKPYYLYLDEAQRYSTDKLVEVLDTKRNIKLRMVLAHHFPSQFPPRILKSIQNNAKTKIAFYVGGDSERSEVAHEMYGGDLDMKQVEYALSQQKKRTAVMKLDKQGSVIAKTHDTPDTQPDRQFLEELLNTENYAAQSEVLKDYDERFPIREDSKSPQPRKAPHRPSDREAPVSRGVQSRRRKDLPASDEKPKEAGKGRPIKI